MATVKELEEQLKKAKEQEVELKELRLQNKFLVDRLEVWAERNFQTRQEKINMTVDDVLEQSKTKTDYRQQQKAQELAEVVDKAREGASKLDTSGIGKEKE